MVSPRAPARAAPDRPHQTKIEDSTLTARTETALPPNTAATSSSATAYAVLWGLSLSHCINDTLQSLITASYPILKADFQLDYSQVGLMTLVFQGTASIFQPIVGFTTDKRPQPFSLAAGMFATLVGLIVLALSGNFAVALLGGALIGSGSAVFHPEASRVARLASGGRFGLAQSIFQIGGNSGSALGPLLAAFVILPGGRPAIMWFAAVALLGMLVMGRIGLWYRAHLAERAARKVAAPTRENTVPPAVLRRTIGVLLVLILSKYVYMASISSYYTFYAIETFGVSARTSQFLLFIYLAGAALGTMFGGPLGDRIGRKRVIWLSIAGILPFTLALPFVGMWASAVLSFIIAFLLSSAFPAIVVYAQELMPGRTGTIAGLFFGFAFGIGAVGAAVLGEFIDLYGIRSVYIAVSFLPALGLFAVFLPDVRTHH
jgi:FSR family fosmidomycin resistance protein-like MFS transporter